MNGNKVAIIALALIFPIVFNAIFFSIGAPAGEMTGTQWLSWGFMHLAYLLIFVTPLLNKDNGGEAVLSWPVTIGAVAYFILEFVIAMVFICAFKADVYYVPALLIQVILFAIVLACILVMYMVNNNTRRHLDEQRMRREQQQLEQQRSQQQQQLRQAPAGQPYEDSPTLPRPDGNYQQ